MCDEKQNECRDHGDPPWEGPQVIPAQIRRVDNLIFRKINQFARANGVEQATPMHGWIIEYLYRHRRSGGALRADLGRWRSARCRRR